MNTDFLRKITRQTRQESQFKLTHDLMVIVIKRSRTLLPVYEIGATNQAGQAQFTYYENATPRQYSFASGG